VVIAANSAIPAMEACSNMVYGQSTNHELCRHIDGVTLQRYRAKAPISENSVVAWIGNVLNAVAYIHSQQIIHRDIKLANIMLANPPAATASLDKGRQVAKLGDFGIATKMHGSVCESVKGTQVYMAPEQQRGSYDAKVDIWALGATLLALLNRKELTVVIATKVDSMKFAKSINQVALKLYSKPLLAIVPQMLQFDPTKRPSAKEACKHPAFLRAKKQPPTGPKTTASQNVIKAAAAFVRTTGNSRGNSSPVKSPTGSPGRAAKPTYPSASGAQHAGKYNVSEKVSSL
jgi:serine/threonine protein kinase